MSHSVEKSVSNRIRIARSLCIFFMTFVHVPPGIAENVYDREAGAFDVIYFVLTRLVGLSSVSLLSIVSGFFIVSSLSKAGPGRLYVNKLQTLVVPLVAWNAAMLVLLVLFHMIGGESRELPALDPMGAANTFLALTEWPLVVPLWFLRDLFVCCLLSPLLLAGLRRSPEAVLAAIALFCLYGEHLLILQRPQLLLFFALGMWLRMAKADERTLDSAARPLLIAMAAMAAVFLTIRIERILFGELPQPVQVSLDTMLRLGMAAGFWLLTGALLKTRAAGFLIRFEPYAFFLFCSHAVVFFFAGVIFRRLFGNFGSDLFPITFFALPLIAVVAAIAGLQLIRRSRLLLFLFNAGHQPPPWPRFAGATEPRPEFKS